MRRSIRNSGLSRSTVLLLALLSPSATTLSQDVAAPQFLELSSATKQRLLQAKSHLANSQWMDAVDIIRTLSNVPLSESNHLVVKESHESGFSYLVPLTRHVNNLLMSLTPDQVPALTELRRRIDPAAAQLLEQGKSNQAIDAIDSLVESYLLSSSGDEALMRLGDFHLQRGNYFQARGYWIQISAQSDIRTSASFHYPDSNIPLDILHARFVLASILERDFKRAARELLQLEQAFPGARGVLGGIEVDLSAKLRELLEETKTLAHNVPSRDWPTFTGNVKRNSVKNVVVDPTFAPKWRISLPQFSDHRSLVSRPVKLVPVEPIVANGTVFICDRSSIQAFQLESGQPLPWSEDDDGKIYSVVSVDTPSIFSRPLPFTLSSDRNQLTALLSSSTGIGVQEAIGLDLAAEGRLLFKTSAPGGTDTNSPNWSFAGPAMTIGDQHFIALRSTAALPEIAVGCFHGENLSWATPICRGGDYSDPFDARLVLSYAEDTVFAVTHTGAIASIDATNGRINWVTSYPRSDTAATNLLERPWFRMRFRSPLVIHRNYVIAAPADYNGIFAVDAFSGRLLWKSQHLSDSFDFTEIIGVTDRHVIGSGRRLWWIDVETGRRSEIGQDNPFPRELQSGLRGYGRGLIAEGQIFWPTRNDAGEDKIYVFDEATGAMIRQPIHLTAANVSAGNLSVAAGYLLVAGDNELVAFPCGPAPGTEQ